jgi:hypothetical protein
VGLAPRDALPNDALVCRGGTCSADRFRQGSGVMLDAAGRIVAVSVNSAAMTPIEVLSAAIPNRQIGVTTVGAIRAIGGTVTPAPSANNRFHCVMGGITPEQAARLFTPVVGNPNR